MSGWGFAVFLITCYLFFPFPSFFHEVSVIFITPCALKHTHTSLLPLPSSQIYPFEKESSLCLSQSQTLSTQFNTHGGNLEGWWQLVELCPTSIIARQGKPGTLGLLLVPCLCRGMMKTNCLEIHLLLCWQSLTRDTLTNSEMYFKWFFDFQVSRGLLNNFVMYLFLWAAVMYNPSSYYLKIWNRATATLLRVILFHALQFVLTVYFHLDFWIHSCLPFPLHFISNIHWWGFDYIVVWNFCFQAI